MIEPVNPEQAKKCLRLSGSTCDAALAWLDGYNGIDHSGQFTSDSLRDFYETYWLKGSEYKDQELKKQL